MFSDCEYYLYVPTYLFDIWFQIADQFLELHIVPRVLYTTLSGQHGAQEIDPFKQINKKMKNWSLIDLWKRFINDVYGVWMGSTRQFNLFADLLNKLPEPFGIRFA